jgi:hypothetical protein
MPVLNVILNGDGCWPDLPAKRREGKLVDMTGDNAPPISAALIRGGMTSGKASVILRIDLPDGLVFLTETSLALFSQAANAMRAASGD